MRTRLQLSIILVSLASLLACQPQAARAQGNLFGRPLSGVGGGGPKSAANVVQVQGRILPADGQRPYRLQVTATVASGWHIYSITQPPPGPDGGPLKTRIKVKLPEGVQVAGEFQALTPPASHNEPAFGNLRVEEHAGTVTWEAPLKLADGVDPKALKIAGSVFAMACAESCLPPENFAFEATLDAAAREVIGVATPPADSPAGNASSTRAAAAGAASPPAGVTEFHHPRIHAAVRGYLEPAAVEPGGHAKLVLTITPTPPYHVYALAESDPKQLGSKPTLIGLAPADGLKFGDAVPSAPPIEHAAPHLPAGKLFYYEAPITWTIDVAVARDAQPGGHEIAGAVGFMSCTEANCDPPGGAEFHGVLKVGPPAAGSVALSFTPTSYSAAAKWQASGGSVRPAAAEAAPARPSGIVETAPAPRVSPLRTVELNSAGANTSLLFVLLSSLVGGALLNLMPCVLPVIGLKVLSFAQQGGQSRGRVLALNLWYTAGLMLVFMVLATLAAGAELGLRSKGLGWGEQFGSVTFNVVMSGLVFSMALSFLGIWEIPLPGFVGSGKATELAAHEGAIGAFFKGVMSTILATPCSGPFLGPVFGFTLQQPPYVIYLIFACVGLGMASPYLLIGLFPSLIRWIPKPGMWMDTFKQMMGFVLLGTVVFLFTFLKRDYLVATFGMLIGLWAGCWWIGRTQLTMELGRKLVAWVQGALVAAAVGWFSFTFLVQRPSVLPWQPFSKGAPQRLAAQGKTVMVDFTADWCATCKLNLATAVDTEDVLKLVEQNGVVPLIADYTETPPEVKEALNSLGSDSIPFLAIFPADHPHEPLVLRDLVTKNQVLDALRQAGPSRDTQRTASNEVR